MKLHQDTNAFRVLIEDIHNKTGYRTDVLEKDYYVVLMLEELAAKHIYDLTVLFSESQIKALLCDSVQMARLLQIRMVEEQERRDGIPGVIPKEFCFFTEAANNSKVKNAYETMQRQYVLRDSDCIAYETAMQALSNIQSQLFKNPAWMECRLPEDSTY